MLGICLVTLLTGQILGIFARIPGFWPDSWVSGVCTRSADWLERSAVQVERSAGWMDGSADWTESVTAGVPGAVAGIPGAALGTLGAATGVPGARKVRWERGLDGRERGWRSSGCLARFSALGLVGGADRAQSGGRTLPGMARSPGRGRRLCSSSPVAKPRVGFEASMNDATGSRLRD